LKLSLSRAEKGKKRGPTLNGKKKEKNGRRRKRGSIAGQHERAAALPLRRRGERRGKKPKVTSTGKIKRPGRYQHPQKGTHRKREKTRNIFSYFSEQKRKRKDHCQDVREKKRRKKGKRPSRRDFSAREDGKALQNSLPNSQKRKKKSSKIVPRNRKTQRKKKKGRKHAGEQGQKLALKHGGSQRKKMFWGGGGGGGGRVVKKGKGGGKGKRGAAGPSRKEPSYFVGEEGVECLYIS